MTVLCVAQDGHFVIIEVDFIDKHIHQPLPVFGVVDVPLAELIWGKADFFCAGDRVLRHIRPLRLIYYPRSPNLPYGGL